MGVPKWCMIPIGQCPGGTYPRCTALVTLREKGYVFTKERQPSFTKLDPCKELGNEHRTGDIGVVSRDLHSTPEVVRALVDDRGPWHMHYL